MRLFYISVSISDAEKIKVSHFISIMLSDMNICVNLCLIIVFDIVSH